MIKPDDGGEPLYVSIADWPRSVPPRVGMRVAFEIADEELPEGACARACLVVMSGGEANG
ncbi:hypothetical protein [Bradyrhizobium sp.]|uniref:hypothetical protein n=1 Tax=Bradyrhizobium sp. TaxID=376 RepID=UPI0026057AC6|nr:hypothetical protein [Bradyrhizobium sp.]